MLLWLLLPLSSAWAKNYTLPADIGANGAFKDCSASGITNTYTCTKKVELDDNDTVVLTTDVTLDIVGGKEFKVAKNVTMNSANIYELNITTSGDVKIEGKENTINGNITASGKVEIKGKDTTINGNITANGDVIIEEKDNTFNGNITANGKVEIKGKDNTIDGNIIANGELIIKKTSTVVTGTCTPAHPQCSGSPSMEAPTVTSQITTDTTPVISGTFSSSVADELTVTVNSITYTLSTDSELTNPTDDNWELDLSGITPLDISTYEVLATSTDGSGSLQDNTNNELKIQAVPTVTSQTTTDTTPIITGTFSSSVATELTVTVNSITYTLSTDSELTNSNDDWALDLSGITALPIDTYNVTAISSGEPDTTSNELVIQAVGPTLTGNLNVDNTFEVYISTDDSVQGTLLASGTDWPTTYALTSALTAGQDYYLHIKATDVGGVAGFLGDFTLTNTDHTFSNGLATLNTNTSNWSVSTTGWSNYQPVSAYGTNGVAPWYTRAEVNASAQWIWSSDNDADNVNYFSTKIAVPMTTPLVEYRFDECVYTGTTNEVIDQIGNFNGGSTGVPSPVDDARINKSLDLRTNNTSDWVSVPNTVVDGLNDFTFSIWFKTSVNKSQQEIFQALGNSTGDDELEIHLKNNNKVIVKIQNTEKELSSSIDLTDGAWHHLALTRVSDQVCLLINGEAQSCQTGVGSGSLSVPSSNAVVIGQEQDSFSGGFSTDQNFEGLLDELKIYDVKLSNNEIKNIYQYELAGNNYDDSPRDPVQCITTPHTPIVDYRFDDCSYTEPGDVVNDESGNFHGVPNGVSDPSDVAAINNSLDLSANGTSDWLSMPKAAVHGLDDFTFSIWFKTSVNKSQQEIFHALGSSTSDDELEISLEGEYTVYIKVRDNSETLTSGIKLTDGNWRHISLTRSNENVCLFVDGARQQCKNGVDSGTLSVTNDDAVVIGQEQDSFGGDFSTDQNFVGLLDELKIYNIKLSDNEIKNIYEYELADNNYDNSPRDPAQCTTTLHHYTITHSSSGVTCEGAQITVTAHDSSHADVTVSSDTALTVSTTPSVDSIVSSPATISSGSSSTTFYLQHSAVLSDIDIDVTDGTYTDSDDAEDPVFNFLDTAFRFYVGGVHTDTTAIGVQVAGNISSTQNFSLKAIRTNTDTGACEAALQGVTTSVDMAYECNNPTSCTGSNLLDITGTSSPTSVTRNNNNATLNYTAVSLAFNASGFAPFTFKYDDAGQVTLHAKKAVSASSPNPAFTLTGSSNAFWTRPAELVVSAKSGITNLNGATSTASTTHAAGEDFDLTVSAYNSLGVITPNYSPGQVQFKLERTGPTLSGSVDGNMTYAAASTLATSTSSTFQNVTLSSFSSGVSTYNAAHYSEVGLLNLDVQDSNYGNAGIIIPATAINIGRFIPDHFKQTVVQHGFFQTTCPTVAATFAYSGQKDEATDSIGAISYSSNPILAITAYNKQNQITQNYYEDSQGSVNDYMKLSRSNVSVTLPTLDQVAIGVDGSPLPLTANMNLGTLSQNDLTTVVPSDNPLPKGVLHYQFSDDDNFYYNRSTNALVAPFTSDIDFSTATITDTDAVNVTTTVDASPTGVEIRFGRLVLENSFGPETSNFPQPMQIEHFDGMSFVVTSNNDCVSYDASKISLTNISLDAGTDTNTATAVVGGTGNFVAGKARTIELKALEAGNQGQMGVLYDTYNWLKYDWDNDGDDDNPFATATFGLFRGNDRIIYMREVYN